MEDRKKHKRMGRALAVGTFFAAGLSLVALVAVPGSSQATEGAGWASQPGPRHHGPPKRPHAFEIFRRLELTDGQRDTVQALREANEEELRAARRLLFQAKRDLREAVREGRDEVTIRERAQDVGAAEGELAVIMSRFHAELRSVLTAEQLETLEKVQEKMRLRHEERRERFRDGRPDDRPRGEDL